MQTRALFAAVAFVSAAWISAARAAQANPFDLEVASRREAFRKEVGRPQAIVPLLGILDLWEEVGDRGALAAFLAEAAAQPGQRADVRARAAYLHAIALDRLGRREEARQVRAALGLVSDGFLVGPFDNEGKAGHAAVFGPEHALDRFDLKARWDGKEREVAWRRLPPVAVQGLVPLDTVLRPEANGTAYVTFAVKAPRAERASVRVGSTGAIKVWVNGRLVLDRDVYRPVRFDQDAAPAVLEAGWNRVTLKVSAADAGGFSYFVRLARPDGGPLDGLVVSAEEADLQAASKTRGHAGRHAVADLGRELEQAARQRPKDARAWRDHGIYRHHVAPDDGEKHVATEALAQAARLSGAAADWAELARAYRDPNDQKKALETALTRPRPPLVAAKVYTRLGDIFYRARRERRAEELWLKALEAAPGFWPARLKLAELHGDRGLPAKAAEAVATLEAALTPAPLKVLRASASLAVRRGRKDLAQKILAGIVEEADDFDALHELWTFARARGELPAALALNDRMRRARPDALSVLDNRAELLEGNGRAEEAAEALEAALAIAPEDAKLLERSGRLLLKLGREQAAIDRFKQSLALRPQNPELRAYLADLRKDQENRADLSRAFGRDVRQLIAQNGKAKDTTGAPARVLYDGQVTRVHKNGLSETYTQRVVEILDERGARAEGDFDLRYTPDTQAVEVRAARVYKPTGEVVEAVSVAEQDLSEPWYGLYYDVRGQIIHFSALEPGDVIDVQYVISDIARRNMFADYFGELHFMQEAMPRIESRYVLIAPAGRTLYFNTPRIAVERREEQVGDERIYTFVARDVPKVDTEPGMPGFSEVAGYVHVSTYRRWEDVAAWYQGLVRSQLEPSPAITRAAREAVKGLKDERAKIRALYNLVVKRTRYVGLEFGIHGYQPYRVSQVFARKFGDCKDKASLLVVMLKEAGIPASLILARTRRGGDLDGEPASLAPFDHAIAYVPKYDLYLDGTAEFSGSDELPAQDQDIPVLNVQLGKLVRTPVIPAERNRVATRWQVKLDATGSARVAEELTITGQAAHEWRNHYQAPGERMDKYEHAWNGKHPGAKLEAVEMALDDLEQPVRVRAKLEVPHWARPDGDEARAALVMPALGREADMLRSYARLSQRRHDLVLGYPWRQEERVTVTLPPGHRVRRLPEAKRIASEFGAFELEARAAGGQVTVTATLRVDRHRVRKDEYAAFRAFCAQVDAAVSQELVVSR